MLKFGTYAIQDNLITVGVFKMRCFSVFLNKYFDQKKQSVALSYHLQETFQGE